MTTHADREISCAAPIVGGAGRKPPTKATVSLNTELGQAIADVDHGRRSLLYKCALHAIMDFSAEGRVAAVDYMQFMVSHGREEHICNASVRAILEGRLDPFDAAREDSAAAQSAQAQSQQAPDSNRTEEQ